MNISVIGTGYVGLVSGVCLAAKGHKVVCVDVDVNKVNSINNGTSPIYEKGLGTLLKENIGTRLTATDKLAQAVRESDVSIIAVGTPFDGDEIDLSYIREVSMEIGTALRDMDFYHVVVVKSTVVPGTTDEVVTPLLEEYSDKKAGMDFGVGMNPEFLREGEAVDDFMNPDRIVLGGIDERTQNVLAEIYSVFENADIVKTNNKTAEMIKYTSNSLLATMISFSNEIGNLCASLGNIDVVDVMRGVHKDKRLTPLLPNGDRLVPGFVSYIEAGCGFGGSCFPKDVKALVSHGKRSGNEMVLLDSVMHVNESQPSRIVAILNKHYPSLKGLRIAVLGLAFKPGTDDMRESPAIPIVNYLIEAGAFINAFDPVAGEEAQKIFGNHHIMYCSDLRSTIEDVDAIILLTRWNDFYEIPDLIKELKKEPLFIDGRRMLDKQLFPRYDGIGLSIR